jgi:putative ABC transport system permease protein
VPVAAILGRDTIGPLARSRAVVGPLKLVQALTGRQGRLTQVVIEPQPGQTAHVKRELRRVAGGRLNVARADAELGLLQQASKPNDQSTSLFAAISAMVGFLFAVNAMLLTVAERRRFIADLRMQGFSPRQVLTVLGFESLVLGGLASLVGLLLGDLLSRAMFSEIPAYLAFAFPVGTQRVVHPEVVVLALAGGILATFLASLRPLLDLRAGVPLDAVFRQDGEPGEAISRRTASVLLLVGGVLVAVTTLLALLVPGATIVGGVTLALATLLLMPAAFSAAAAKLSRLCRRTRHCNILSLALMELETTKTRSIALAAVGALAVYGGVAIGGARNDLIRGLDQHTAERLGTADLWVTNGNKDLTTDSFRLAGGSAAIARAPGVASVRVYQSSMLDVAGRRIWVVGRPRADSPIVPPSQVIDGDIHTASKRLRQGGWATVSAALAKSEGLKVGDPLQLPTPAGSAHLRVAAITTNLGWGPGAIILNRSDYRRQWRSDDPAALEVDLRAGVTPAAGKRAVERALGRGSPLQVQTFAERQAEYHVLARQGLTRLSQISTLLLIAAALAMASAMGAAVWQRRQRLAALKVQGFDRWQLWRGLLHETGFVLAVGCGVGAALGVYGHVLASRWLELTTGFPTAFAFEGDQVVVVLALVAGSAYAVTALPGYIAAQTPMRTSFQE